MENDDLIGRLEQLASEFGGPQDRYCVVYGEAAAALTAAEARIKMLEEPVKVGELGRDDLRRRAKALLERNGWKPGDQFSAHSTIELMISLAIDAVQSPLDQCAYPECGCCHDAMCAEALTGASNDG